MGDADSTRALQRFSAIQFVYDSRKSEPTTNNQIGLVYPLVAQDT